MTKLTVRLPALPRPTELMSPSYIQRAWAEARREEERYAPVLRDRRRRRVLHA